MQWCVMKVTLIRGWGNSPGEEKDGRREMKRKRGKQGDKVSVCGSDLGWGRLNGFPGG